jgi:deazaflavin-dependent oxidoreductase (nitroreductase family)
MISTMERIGLTAHQWLYEKTGGRIDASVGGRPTLLLRHVGRKTGQPRTSALLYARDGDNYAVIASKGGDPKHPGWFHNLTANPDVEIQVGRERIPVTGTRRRRRRAGAHLGATSVTNSSGFWKLSTTRLA